MNTPRNFRTDFSALAKAAKEVSQEQNLPSLKFPNGDATADVVSLPVTQVPVSEKSTSEKKARAARKAEPSIQKRVALDLPVYLIKAIGKTSLDRNVTRRFLFLEAFRAAGYTVNDADMQEDGRRDNA